MSDKASSGTESRNFDRLLLCPFCGGEAEVIEVDYGMYETGYAVYCSKCCMKLGVTGRIGEAYKWSAVFGTEAEAIEAWNTRAERTECRLVEHGSLGNYESFVCWSCSECNFGWHHSIYDKQFSYCPNCGAKVVSE